MFINSEAVRAAMPAFKGQAPFDHTVIDNFFLPEIAQELEREFPDFDSPVWQIYDNAIEVKKLCNYWNHFPSATYRVFSYLNSHEFTSLLSESLGIENLSSDPGLNGGGWHIHKQGGKLNTHLDYNLHPKLQLQRKLNLIVYLNSAWQPEWGGQLGLWAQKEGSRRPGELVRSVEPKFNRAVLFDTTQDSWHGLPEPLTCPEGQTRKSIAVYYLAPAPTKTEERGKALFAPTAEQESDPAVLELIARRADIKSAASVYEAANRD